MATLWINAGKLVVCGGRFAVQATCPCADDCYADLIAAIRERQPVVGRAQWPAVPDPPKSLAECIAEVNAMAPSFILGLYTGGAAVPTMCSSSYATGAADFCELYDLVRALVSTTSNTWLTSGNIRASGTRKEIFSGASPLYPTMAEAMAAALATTPTETGAPAYAEAMWAISKTAGGYNARAIWSYTTVTVTGLPTGVAKVARLFLKTRTWLFATYHRFDAQGQAWVTAENTYCQACSVSLAAGESGKTGPVIGDTAAPPNGYDPVANEWHDNGYSHWPQGTPGAISVVDWSFVHV